MGIIASLIIGAIAGWLGGLIITGAIGAVVVLFLLNIVFGKKK